MTGQGQFWRYRGGRMLKIGKCRGVMTKIFGAIRNFRRRETVIELGALDDQRWACGSELSQPNGLAFR